MRRDNTLSSLVFNLIRRHGFSRYDKVQGTMYIKWPVRWPQVIFQIQFSLGDMCFFLSLCVRGVTERGRVTKFSLISDFVFFPIHFGSSFY